MWQSLQRDNLMIDHFCCLQLEVVKMANKVKGLIFVITTFLSLAIADADQGWTKVLVTTGEPHHQTEGASEIIDLSNPVGDCTDYLPYPGDGIHGAIGGLINGASPFVCGGYPETLNCYNLDDPGMKTQMLETRWYAATLPTEDGASLWVTGGAGRKTTEYVSPGKESVYGPDLPASRLGHCLVQLDKETYMIIGGFASDGTRSSYLFHVENQTWTRGPNLSREKVYITCQVLETSNGAERIVVVAGGYIAPDPFDDIDTWIIGSSGDFVRLNTVLPVKMFGASSIVTSDKKSMVIVGGFDRDSYFSSLIKITCRSAKDCMVEEMEQKLRVARDSSVAMLVPDSMANCN